MLHRTTHVIVVALVALATGVSAAAAATPAQIHADAEDGSMDGTYSLADLQAADRAVSAEQREYFGWEDVYRAALRALSKPGEVEPAVAVDADRNGTISTVERDAAVKKTKAKCTKANDSARRSAVCRKLDVTPVEGDPDEAEPREPDNEPASKGDADDSGGGASPLLWLVAGIPLLVVGIGAWRMRGRNKGDDAS